MDVTPSYRANLAARARNRTFALALASVPLCLFVVVIGLGVLLHFAEAHHVFAGL
ncbi:MAG: hypothetical protein ACREFQ_01680 [Stellaceae bacterium]